MDTAQQILYVLGIIALALVIIWLIAAIFLVIFLKKSLDHLNKKLNGLGGALAGLFLGGRKYVGVMGSGLIIKLINNLISGRRKRSRRE
jgi:hypothetical protein